MKKNAKKLLALLMALIMVMCVIPVSAEEGNVARVTEYEENGFRYIVGTCYDTYSQIGYEPDVEIPDWVADFDKPASIIIGATDELEGDIVVPSTLGGYPVIEVTLESEKITGITLPDSVLWVFSCAGCVNLERFIAGNGLLGLNSGAFVSCQKLREVKLPESLLIIKNEVFSSCRSLENIELPSNIEEIGYAAFRDTAFYNNMDNWDDKGVLYCGDYLLTDEFMHSSVEEYTVKDGTKLIANNAFWFNTNLKKITIPDSVCIIGNSAFRGCENLETVDFSKNVKYIGELAFYECASLKGIELSEGLIMIDDWAFRKCKNITEITIPSTVKVIRGGAFQDTGLTSVVIPKGVARIYGSAFGYASCDSSICGDENCPGYTQIPFTIYGYRGSEAQKYAELYHITFVPLDQDPTETCTCRCHKTGFNGFIYKFLRIFWRIFKTNEYCECGAKHY